VQIIAGLQREKTALEGDKTVSEEEKAGQELEKAVLEGDKTELERQKAELEVEKKHLRDRADVSDRKIQEVEAAILETKQVFTHNVCTTCSCPPLRYHPCSGSRKRLDLVKCISPCHTKLAAMV